MDGYSTACEPPLFLIAQEQAELNQSFLALVLEKMWEMYEFMPETITFVMCSSQREGSLTWKQQSSLGKSE